ncbi:helicase associated domain-containing protein [Streptomyces sp. NPDC059474]|uniref:helicase associated domain-containing protein n=1 Tax=Streptomyces sp. NPDC059474 TaxID=3346846 RepID=UPI0036C9440C
MATAGRMHWGAWVSEQRRQFRLGTLKAWRAELLDALGMVWSVTDARFYKNLSVARGYHAIHRTLAAPKDAVVHGVPVGQWLANLRKPGGLGKDEERAEARRASLVAIDPDWNPDWPINWQRHYAALAGLLEEGATLAEILPSVAFRGQDVGTWLTTQRESWEQLSDGQRDRLAQLGVVPLPPEPETPTKPPKAALGPFERGVAALAQYKSPHRLRDSPQSPHGAAGGRHFGAARRIPIQHKSQAHQTHRRAAPATRQPRTPLGGMREAGDRRHHRVDRWCRPRQRL